MPRASNLQRWTDLLAALLRRHYPATFEELARDVPAYIIPEEKRKPNETESEREQREAGERTKRASVMRKFERDKDDLRSFGIAIEMLPSPDGDAARYHLNKKNFYLPYISMTAEGGAQATTPRRPAKAGYRALMSLVFEPDELSLIGEAAKRIVALGDPVLTEEVESAIRKLTFDLPVPELGILREAAPGYPAMAAAAGEDVFEALNEALTRRKIVQFNYRTMETDSIARRTVEPYGLFFLSSHWYLAARDRDKVELRNFRLSRIRNVIVNELKAQKADYDIPEGFSLREHARSRQPWELGDGAGEQAIVEFRNPTGAAQAAARLGQTVEGSPLRRSFRFRRIDSFARWLLSFGGEAVPLEPEPLVAAFEKHLRETRSVYGGGS